MGLFSSLGSLVGGFFGGGPLGGALGGLGGGLLEGLFSEDSPAPGGYVPPPGSGGASGTGTDPSFFDGINMSGIGSQIGGLADQYGGSAISGYAAYKAQQDTNAANAALAQKQMDFQSQQGAIQRDFNQGQAHWSADYNQNLQNTAYQRTVADLKAAGLNPMLAYSQGPTSGPGASGATASTASGAMARMDSPALAAINAATSAAQIKNLDAGNELIRAQIDKTNADTVQSYSSAGNLDAQRDKTRQEMQSFEDRWSTTILENKLKQYEVWAQNGLWNKIEYDAAVHPEIRLLFAKADELEKRAKLLGLEVPRAVQMAALWNSSAGRKAAAFEVAPKSLTSAATAAGLDIGRK